MKLVDANVLLYAVNEDAPNHAPARSWLDASLGESEAIGFAWVVLLAFVRLSTRPALFPSPLAAPVAFDVVEHWLNRRAAVVVHPTDRHANLLRGLLESTGTAANLVGDAHLAALALEHGAKIVSFDRNFGRFEGVRWELPGA